MSKLYALDIETTGLCPWSDVVLGIGVWSPDDSQYFTTIPSLTEWLKGPGASAEFIMHSGAFDVNFLRRKGVNLQSQWAYDTRTIASIIYPWPSISPGQRSQFGLENLGIQWLGKEAYKLDRTNMAQYTQEQVRDYCLEDCELTYRIFQHLVDAVQKQSGMRGWTFVEKWVMPATKAAANMEYNGLGIDLPSLLKFKEDTEIELKDVEQVLHQITEKHRQTYQHQLRRNLIKEYDVKKETYLKNHPKADPVKTAARYANLAQKALARVPEFNFSSTPQLLWLLKSEGATPIDPLTNKESTATAVLKQLAADGSKTAEALVNYRRVEKLLNANIPNLLDNIKPDGRVHGRLHIGGTRTGRLSSSGPNMQQCTKGRLRQCIIADKPDTVLFCGDYSQLEVRVIAELSKEPKMVEAFKQGIDPYAVFAKDMFSLDTPVEKIKKEQPAYRDAGKVGVLSILYRTGARKLRHSIQKSLGRDVSLEECKQYIENFKAGLSVLQAYDLELQGQLLNKKLVWNLMGRPFRLEDNEEIYMKGLNTMVQGSASDLVAYSQTALVIPELKRRGVWHEPKLWVHDEVIIELKVDEAEQVAAEIIKPLMTTKLQETLNLAVPLELSYACSRSWEKA